MKELLNLIFFRKKRHVRKNPKVDAIYGHSITILVPAEAETEDEKAKYILDAVTLMETHIQIIKTKVK